MILLIIDQWRVKRDGRFRDTLQFDDALLRQTHGVRDFLRAGVAPQFLIELARDALHLVDQFYDVHGDVDSARMLRHSPADRLANPPCGIGRETEAAPRIEFLRGPNQSQVPLLNEIEQRDAMITVVFGDTDDKAQVCFHQAALRLYIPLSDTLRDLQFLLR